MPMTYKTTTEWTNRPQNADMENEKAAFLQQKLSEGKTDNMLPTPVHQPVDPNVTFIGKVERYWLDETTANEFVTFINGLSTKYSGTQTTTVSPI